MTEKREVAIQVDNVSKRYKLYDRPLDRIRDALGLTRKQIYHEHYALQNIDLTIYKGECVGIIGTNGAGKSTILKIITGVLTPTEGDVTIKGRISALLELGAGFNMEYTGLENIYINGTMTGFSREEIDARLDDILKFADIGDFVHQPVKTYSSGMFVRLAFAVAINIDPEILIVDEALSVGDVFFQAKCYHKFEEFKKNGKTILFVSHALDTIQKYCDRVVLLNKGQKVAEDTPKPMIDLYNKMITSQKTRAAGEGDKTIGESSAPALKKEPRWKDSLGINPATVEYGSKEAEIIDFGIMNEAGEITNTLEWGRNYRIRMKVHFHSKIETPVFAFTIKSLKGVEITGTNTLLEDFELPENDAGMEIAVQFEQKMLLRGNEYLLSLGCTGFMDGEFMVYHRLYDVCNMTVMSVKDKPGYFATESKVELI